MSKGFTFIAVGAALALSATVLLVSGGPLATDDLWWHLGLGHAYASQGPWLNADPHLHTAVQAPPANAWLFDISLSIIDKHLGLQVLRGAHAVLLAGILFAVARLFYIRSQSAAYAALATNLFIACAAYRLNQLRPDLMTLLATILLATLLFLPREPPSLRRSALAVLLCGLWSNLHPGFLLGPALIAAAAGSSAVGALIGSLEARQADRTRAIRFCWIFIAGILATGLNPEGFESLTRYTQAGLDSAGQAMVIDEWRAFAPFTKPHTALPPSPLAFGVTWLALLTTPIAIALRLWRRIQSHQADNSLALVALAAVGLVAPFVAVRFLWLILFPLLLGADFWNSAWSKSEEKRASASGAHSGALAAIAAGALLLVPLYAFYAERSTQPLPFSADRYADAYDADRYSAHAVWFLADSQVEGRLFHPYFMGGFLDYWLAPACQTFIDGSLNVPTPVLQEYGRIQQAGHSVGDTSLESLLDDREIDFYIGVGLPMQPLPGRPWRYTTEDLSRSEEWMLVFRSLRSAVYMRRHPRNATNLSRIAAYYKAAGIPFPENAGLDIASLLKLNVPWAIRHGAAPRDFAQLKASARSKRLSPKLRVIARDRLATTYAVLGLCEEALAIDTHPDHGRGELNPAQFPLRADTRKRRIEACQGMLRGSAPLRHVWLTPTEAGRVKGVEESPEIRERVRHAEGNYSGSQ